MSGKQLEMQDLFPSTVKDDTRKFVEGQYVEQREEQNLKLVRTRHEGYGLLAEAYTGVVGSVDGLKSSMKDCLKMLAGDDTGFQSAADQTYSALVDLVVSATQMSIQAMNVAWQIQERRMAEPCPLVDMAEELAALDNEDGDMDGIDDIDT